MSIIFPPFVSEFTEGEKTNDINDQDKSKQFNFQRKNLEMD